MYKLLFLFLFAFGATYCAPAQDANADTIKARLARYASDNLTEKIYLHTDRNFYIPGEIIWFKTYLFNATTQSLPGLSKVAYVDVLDAENKPFLQAKILLQQGTGNGSLYLPLTMPTGAYKIRAYTSWMKNYSATFFYEKKVQVVNTFMSAGIPAADSASRTDLQFFPEGGYLLQNVDNKVAFKVTGADGFGATGFTGAVLNQHNDTIIRFRPYKSGIGHFTLKPVKGDVYRAEIITVTGTRYVKELPLSNEKGYAIQLHRQSGKIQIDVNGNVPSNATNGIYLLLHHQGQLQQILLKNLENQKATFIIPEDNFWPGITHITLFNSNRQPVCERLYFKKPSQLLQVKANADELQYAPRKKITVNIRSTQTDGRPVNANLSIAVFRIDSLQQTEQNDISSFLWLSSDLKGYIENAGWYMSNTDSSNTGIDNLMLTHGWRRFNWHEVLQAQPPPLRFLPEIDGHIIYGKLLDSVTQKPYPTTPVFLSIPGVYTHFYTAMSDPQGRFKFYTRNVLGQGEIMLQADGAEQKPFSMDVQSPFAETYSTEKITLGKVDSTLKTALEKASLNAQVQRKYAWPFMKQFNTPDVDTSRFYGKPDEQYLLDDYTRFTTMEEVLREYVLGVMVGRSGGKFKLTMLDQPNNRLFRDNPLVLLDGVPVLDMDKILAYDPLKVRRIELVKRRYYYGPLMFDGIVNMITYKGNIEAFQVDPKTVILDYDGLQLEREFYAPVYDTEEKRNNHIADYRNLLFWSPAVYTNAQGNTTLSFYSSDVTGRYRAMLEGVGPAGLTGSTRFDFEIK